MSKVAAYRKHVARRSLERIGYEFSSETIADFIRQIRTGTGEFIEKQSLRVTKWIVTHPRTGEKVPVIYDKKRGAIVTVLPL